MNRRLVAVALLGFIGFSLHLVLAPTVHAKCANPTIVLNSAKGERGSTLIVKGEYFLIRCDEFQLGLGSLPTTREPTKNIRILFKQGDQSTVLATVDADADLRFSVTITIPGNATIGKATFTAEADSIRRYIQPLAFEVVESGSDRRVSDASEISQDGG